MSNTTELHNVDETAENAGVAKAVSASREPVRAPEGLATPSVSTEEVPTTDIAKEQQPVKLLGVQLPEALANVSRSVHRKMSSARVSAVKSLPGFVVNNSSNILGAAHVGTEIMMFKASLGDGQLIQNPKNPINWVYEPLKTVYTDVFKKATSGNMEYGALLKGNPVKNFHDRLTNCDAATRHEYEAQLHKVSGENVKISNRWQTRSTLMGLIVWSLSAVLPEKKETPEEIERMAIMRATNPMGYVGERLKEAVWIPEWSKHKRQMIGLGIMVSGICSSIGAWRNRYTVDANTVNHVLEGVEKISTTNAFKTYGYKFNQSYLMTGLLTFSSSFPLLFGLDEKSGYGGFGGLMMLRIPFLPSSIHSKYKNKEQGAHWYTAGMVSFQAENLMQGLFGGAQKIKKTLPDGTVVEEIIDNHETLQKAKEEIKEIRQHTRSHPLMKAQEAVVGENKEESLTATPSSLVTKPQAVERAMPERLGQEAVAV